MIVVVSTAANCPAEVARSCVSVIGAPHMLACADRETWEASQKWNRGALLEPPGTTQLQAVSDMIAELDPWDVVVWLDADGDELTVDAIGKVARAYDRDPYLCLTYGSFRTRDGVQDYEWNRALGLRYLTAEPRREVWRAAHLRTFRAGLFQAIPREYLTRADGSWLTTCVDRAPMLAMLELCGSRYQVLTDVLYIYNRDHERNRSLAERVLEEADCAYVHSLPPLPRLERKPW